AAPWRWRSDVGRCGQAHLLLRDRAGCGGALSYPPARHRECAPDRASAPRRRRARSRRGRSRGLGGRPFWTGGFALNRVYHAAAGYPHGIKPIKLATRRNFQGLLLGRLNIFLVLTEFSPLTRCRGSPPITLSVRFPRFVLV